MHRSYPTASLLKPHVAMQFAVAAGGLGSETVAGYHQTFRPCNAPARVTNRRDKVNADNSLRAPPRRSGDGQATCTGGQPSRHPLRRTGVGRERMANIRNRYLFLSDFLLLAAVPFAAYAIRFEGTAWSAADSHTAIRYAVLAVAVKLGILWPFGMYSRLWRHASIPDLAKIIQATAASTAVCAALGIIALPASGLAAVRVPISVAI